uniref:Ariadne RBR E3 ubiquitin protein ligase 1 n=1 Tax=Oncorhynchus kisutch TaxID=8019 RepID=A0A8C7K4X1_ONCKI
MDSDEGYNYEFDEEEEECSEDSAEEDPEDDTLEVELDDPVVAGGERDECGETGGSGLGPGQDEEDYRFEVLTAEQILQHMVECIREVNDVIQNPATITRILLSHFNWDKEKLMERYFDGNLDKLTRLMNTRSSAQDLPCQICYLNYPNSFCMQCWGDYLTTKIIEEGMGQVNTTNTCLQFPPAHSCDILVDDNTVM